MPDGPGLELIMAELNRAHPGAVLDTAYDREQAALIIDPDHVLEVLTWLRDTPGQEYGFLSSLHAADYLPAAPRFAVHYELLNRDRYERIRVKALLPDPAASHSNTGHHPTGIDGRAGGEEVDHGNGVAGPSATGRGPASGVGQGDEVDSGGTPGEGRPTGSTSSPEISGAGPLPEIDSCVALFPTADFQEREAFDFFGIVFRGHPDLRRMFMPEDYGGHPQRRDFPIGGEPVIFTRDEPSDPGWWR